ncbi:hypothetical protein [Lachnotalea glycerini]|uniref:Apea-like HEPN domain-containing protein n=1 Tax=Lachnotalea glycerini TaxID=1763509 RepID=A0A371JDW1_9FIRM|nr:hypothetical protein [Lachnotalea glycerini]RDY30964.1 hypothetical protein CG710_011850 [Lachnotalea glycerini]
MECVKILCCGKENGKLSTISQLIQKAETVLGILVKNRTGECLADLLHEEIDDEESEYYEPYKAMVDFDYQAKDCKMELERITKNGNRYIKLEITYNADDDISFLNTSVWFDFKEKIIELLHENFEQIFWLSDSQNTKIATDLYNKLNGLENYLREIINTYMSIKHGGDWFEKYSYEDYINKYMKFSEWFRKSRYSLFKMVDSHLYNLEIDDIFDALKAAKKKQITNVVRKALKDIKSREKDKAGEIADVKLLDIPSLWDEERFDEIFDKTVVGRWEDDLSKRRNMIAHNKMICRDMYYDTLSTIDFFEKRFKNAEELLNNRIKSEELLEVSRLLRDIEIVMNLEDCDINPDLPEEQDIIDNLNETDDFMYLSGIISDKIACIGNRVDELLSSIESIKDALHEDSFFENDRLVEKGLLQQYVEFAYNHHQYSAWKTLLERDMSIEIYQLIEPGIFEYLYGVEEQLKSIKEGVFFVDLDCFSEGELVRIKDFDGNIFAIELSGWFCPERGSSNEIYVNWTMNGDSLDYGGIYISYGDYEMTDDDIPLPCVEDELIVKFDKINSKLENVVDEILIKLDEIEDHILEIEI